MRLWVRLAPAMALVALAPLTVVGVQAARSAATSAEELSRENLRREAQLHAEVVGRSVAEQQAHAEAWTQVFPGQLESFTDAFRASYLAAVYRGTPAAVTVVLVDGDGLPVVPPVFAVSGGQRVPSSPERAEALLRRLPLTEAREQGSAVGEPWLAGGLGSVPSVPIAVLAAGPSGTGDVLVLGLEVQLAAAEDMTRTSVDAHGVALFDASGNVLVGPGHPLLRPDLLQALLQTDSDFQYGRGEGEVLGSIVPVPFTSWSVAVFEPRTLVRAPARQIQNQLWPLFGLAGLIAIAVAVGIAGTLSRPVEDLRDAVLDLAEGARGRQTGVERSDEIGDLARAFNHMSVRLDTSRQEIDAQQQEIEAFNRELQQRVADRTRQLEEAQAELVRSGQLAAVAQVGAGLAHELNNPLAAVLGLSQVLKMRYPQEALLADLEGEAARCREVVGDLLRFTSGEVDPEEAPVVDLRDVLDEVVRLVGGAFKQRGVALITAETESAAPLKVRVDRVTGSRILAQVLHALRAALGSGATLTVTPAATREGSVEVRLQSDRPLASSTSRHDDWMASGLDLWVARQLLDRLHGRLEERETQGGALWVLSLPGAP